MSHRRIPPEDEDSFHRLIALCKEQEEEPVFDHSKKRAAQRLAGFFTILVQRMITIIFRDFNDTHYPYEKPRYYAVSIRPQRSCCNAVLEFEGRRFLSTEAPPIPVPLCQRKKCNCYYVHYPDVRQEDRRSPYQPEARLLLEERRTTQSRLEE